jgi:hypothetical protein
MASDLVERLLCGKSVDSATADEAGLRIVELEDALRRIEHEIVIREPAKAVQKVSVIANEALGDRQ